MPQFQTAAVPVVAALPAVQGVQYQAGMLLNRLYQYLDKNLAPCPALGKALPSTIDAVKLYSAGLYPQSLAQTLMVYQWISGQPGMFPPLHSA